MKKASVLVFLVALTGFNTESKAALMATPTEVKIPVEHVFAPKGFDTNDNSQVIISGWLPNLCHKVPTTKVQVDGNKVTIKLTALRYHHSNPLCAPVTVPFVHSVDLGLLDKGKYDIRVNHTTPFGQKAQLLVDESSSDAVDDHIYANVEYIEAKKDQGKVIYKGHNPSDCLVLDEVKYVDNGTDTYSVLPVMKQISDFCPMKMTPFTIETQLPKKLKANKALFHVRAMDGKSVNRIVDYTKDM